jgi:uncharacterized protein
MCSEDRYKLGNHRQLAIQEAPGKGRGLFSLETIDAGDVIDVTPVLVLSEEVSAFLMRFPEIADSLLLWEGSENRVKTLAIGFGCISMCNHSANANARLERVDLPSPRFVLVAIRYISIGEEITLAYRFPLQTFLE